MIALGVALVGAAAAITACLFMGPASWPFLAIVLPTTTTNISMQFLVALADVFVTAINGSILGSLALGGFSGGGLSIGYGIGRFNEGQGNKNSVGSKMKELHGSFFRSTDEVSKEVTNIEFVPESAAIPDYHAL